MYVVDVIHQCCRVLFVDFFLFFTSPSRPFLVAHGRRVTTARNNNMEARKRGNCLDTVLAVTVLVTVLLMRRKPSESGHWVLACVCMCIPCSLCAWIGGGDRKSCSKKLLDLYYDGESDVLARFHNLGPAERLDQYRHTLSIFPRPLTG